jgi:YD repeat-containing protein
MAAERSLPRYHREVRVLDLAGGGPASARSYDRAGRLVEVTTSPGGRLRVPVAPGITVASR